MALRHPVPSFDVGILARGETSGVPRFTEPPSVVFRPGLDKTGVVKQILGERSVQVTAAVGAGKSVRLPQMMVEQSGGLVVHCVPSRLLAWSLYDYVRTIARIDVSFVDDVEQELPKGKGLVLMSNATFSMRMVAWRSGAQEPPEIACLFMDESHESDFSSGVLREVARSQEYIRCVAFSSATPGPTESRKREADGRVSTYKYKPQATGNWDLNDVTQPWAPVNFDGNVLVFVDKDREASQLMAKFQEYDLEVFRLHGKMSLSDFQQTWEAIKDPLRGMNVVVADYTFRSGFTFTAVTRIIETGRVLYHTYDGEVTRRLERFAYNFEVVQGTARGGRVAGSACAVFVPDEVYENVICDLEAMEIDAAALLFRMMGYRPPKRFLDVSPFASGLVPKDIGAALNSPLSMRALDKEDLCEWSELFNQVKLVRPVARNNVGSPIMKVPPRPRSPCGKSASESEREKVIRAMGATRSVSVVPSGVVKVVEYDALGLGVSENEFASDETVFGSASDGSVTDSSISAVPGGHSRVSSVTSVCESDSSGSFADDGVNSGGQDDLGGLLREVEVRNQDAGVLGSGRYIYYPGIESVVDAKVHFADGYPSLERLLQGLGGTFVSRHWSADRSLAAVKVAVDYYNDSLLQVRAVESVVRVFKAGFDTMAEFVDAGLVHKWLVGLHETRSEHETKLAAAVRALQQLRERGYEETDMGTEREVDVGAAWLKLLMDVARLRIDGNSPQYVKGWRDKPLPSVEPKVLTGVAYHAFGREKAGFLLGSEPVGHGALMAAGARRSALTWLKPEGPSHVGGLIGGSMRERVAKAISGLK